MTPKKKRVSQKNELVVSRKLVHRQNGYFVLFVRLVTFVTYLKKAINDFVASGRKTFLK